MLTDCECLADEWRCQSTCPGNEKCEQIDESSHKCISREIGECRAWGDPHVVTFDGAQNDVYGVAIYVLAESLGNVNPEHDFRVRMKTEAWSHGTAVVNTVYFDFYDHTGTVVSTVVTDRHGNSDLDTNGNVQPILYFVSFI